MSATYEEALAQTLIHNRELAALRRLYIRLANSNKPIAERIHRAIVRIETEDKS
jgi:hypothetical protein